MYIAFIVKKKGWIIIIRVNALLLHLASYRPALDILSNLLMRYIYIYLENEKSVTSNSRVQESNI